jgi:hypothetical protein
MYCGAAGLYHPRGHRERHRPARTATQAAIRNTAPFPCTGRLPGFQNGNTRRLPSRFALKSGGKISLPSKTGLDKNSRIGGVRPPSVFVEVDGPCHM